jgi:hypothetical protein
MHFAALPDGQSRVKMMAEIIHMSQQICISSRDGVWGKDGVFECLAPSAM